MSAERFELIIDRERWEPVDEPGATFSSHHAAAVEAEWAIAVKEKRGPHALQWTPNPIGWTAAGGRAQIRRVRE